MLALIRSRSKSDESVPVVGDIRLISDKKLLEKTIAAGTRNRGRTKRISRTPAINRMDRIRRSAAPAAIVASAMAPLNIRSGPGPQYSIIGAIPDRARAIVTGCIQGSLWCQVSYNGQQGWAYSQYLTANLSGRSFAVAESVHGMPAVTYQAPVETVGSVVSFTTTLNDSVAVLPC